MGKKMRKIISVLFVFCMGVVLLNGGTVQNIKIGYEGVHEGPFPATTVFKGDTTIIRWDASGMSGDIQIRLLHQNGVVAQVIAPSYPVGDIPKSYLVNHTLSPGMYFIRIHQGESWWDSYLFRIGPARSIGWVNVFLEGLPDPPCFRTGQTIAVSWDQSNILGEVDVVLRSVANPSKQVMISQNRPYDDIPATYLIPHNTQLGNYTVEVRQGSVIGASDPFEICAAPLPLPDFIIKDISWSFPQVPPSPYYMTIKGKVVNVHMRKKFIGGVPPVEVKIRKDGRNIWSTTVKFRKPGKLPASFSLNVPKSVKKLLWKGRSFTLIMEVDPLEQVRESNEFNNKYEKPITKPILPVKKIIMKPVVK